MTLDAAPLWLISPPERSGSEEQPAAPTGTAPLRRGPSHGRGEGGGTALGTEHSQQRQPVRAARLSAPLQA